MEKMEDWRSNLEN